MTLVLSEALPSSELTIDELSAQICELSAHIAAATCRFLLMLAEFDRREGWKEIGVKSFAHWLAWKCGLQMRAAREKVRVANALADLPLITEAFSSGELSYSKVRAITRIASPQTEADLLVFARSGTANHVEKMVRGYRKNMPLEAKVAQDAFAARYCFFQTCDDGTVEMKAKLTAEEAALVKEALEKILAASLAGALMLVLGVSIAVAIAAPLGVALAASLVYLWRIDKRTP